MNAFGPESPEWTILSEILARHRIAIGDVRIVEDGHINRVAVVGEKFVVRFSTDAGAEVRLRQEASLMKSLERLIPTANVLQYGNAGPAYFQIRAYIHGESLADSWPALPVRKKQAIVAQVITIARTLHEQRFDEFGYLCLPEPGGSSWRDCKSAEFETIAADLRASSLFPLSFIDEVCSFFAAESVCFEHAETAVLVHNDLWLGNLIVNADGIAGLIDFELAQKAPRDAELFKIESFCNQPWRYGKQGEFRDFLRMFAEGYPELFMVPRLRERLRLYELITVCKSFLFGLGDLPAVADSAEFIQTIEQLMSNCPVRHGTAFE